MKRIPKKLDPEKEEELTREPKEKKDTLAMLAAAFLTLFLPTVLVLLLFCGLIYLILLLA